MHMGRLIPGGLLDPAKVLAAKQTDTKAGPDRRRQFVRKQAAENQNRRLDAAIAQGHGFLELGDGQQVRTRLHQAAGNRHGAMAVGIGLDHGYEAGWLDVLLNLAVVGAQVVQMNGGKGSGEHDRWLSVQDLA
ncbi:hypothetical protein DESC_830111 [Desulfosarcina cetonica]|nr:hypothetical protein DESC_830111 [Desulfosarcina cetonica]